MSVVGGSFSVKKIGSVFAGTSLACLVALVGLMLPTSAFAYVGDTIDIDGTTLTFTSPAGKADDLSFHAVSTSTILYFDDAVTDFSTSDYGADDAALCGLYSGTNPFLGCDMTGITTFVINLRDGNDKFTQTSSGITAPLNGISVTISGGSGDDTIKFNTANTVVHTFNGDSGNDTINAYSGPDVISGGDDFDTVDYASHGGSGVTVDFDGVADDGNGDDLSLGLYDNVGTDVEGFIGTSSSDSVYDVSGTANTFNGGATGGTDTVIYSSATAAVNVSLDNIANDGVGCPSLCEGDDVQSTIENLVGSNYDDALTGSSSNNTISGGDGNDDITGGSGNDTVTGDAGDDDLLSSGTTTTDGNDSYDGGSGTDGLSYSTRTGTVDIDLNGSATSYSGNGTGTESDTITTDTENFYLGEGNDTYREPCSNSISNTVYGGDGNDTFYSSASSSSGCNDNNGDDSYYGGDLAGVDSDTGDTVNYDKRGYDVDAEIGGTSEGQSGEADLIDGSIENLTGGSGNDTLAGDADNNTITGGAGTDSLYDGAGIDTLTGGTGNDVFNPSEDGERDTFTESSGTSTYGTDLVDYSAVTDPSHAVGVTFDGVYDDGVTGCTTGTTGTCDSVSSAIEDATGGSGDDTLTGSSSANTLNGGDGDDTLNGSTGADTINGGAGDDEITGGAGSATSDILNGDAGDDTFYGGSSSDGTDTINGAEDNDTLDYSSRTSTITLNLGSTTDTYTNIENAKTGSAADTLTGSDEINKLYGGGGNDTIDGDGGADLIDGESGSDTADYSSRGSEEDITVTLDSNASDGADCGSAAVSCEGDFVTPDTENLKGGSGNDSFYTYVDGTAVANTFTGGSGDDSMYDAGDNDGADTFTETSGNGEDTIYYTNHTVGLVVDIDSTTGDDGADTDGNGAANEGDTVSTYVDNIVGGSGDDRLTGSSYANALTGGVGDDTLNGSTGDDTLNGGDDADTVFGGSGEDNIEGNDGADNIDGEGDGDVIDAGAGDDIVSGGSGDDKIYSPSNDGADTLSGGSDIDSLNYTSRTGDLTITVNNGAADDGEQCETGSTTCEGDAIGDGFESIETGSGSDTVTGDPLADDFIFTGDGKDTILSPELGGVDQFMGGGDIDTVDFTGRTASLTVTLDSAANDGEDCDSGNPSCESLYIDADIENVTGGSGNDDLTGDTNDNVLNGAAGDDVLDGASGADVLTGGDNLDLADYSDRSSDIEVSDDGQANDGTSGEDDNVDAEKIITGTGSDVVVGGNNTTYLDSGSGADKLTGGAGNEDIYAGANDDTVVAATSATQDDGADYVNCGDGVDTATVGLTDTVDASCENVTVLGEAEPTTTTTTTTTVPTTTTTSPTITRETTTEKVVTSTDKTTVTSEGVDTVAPLASITKPKCTLKKAKTKKAKAKAKKAFKKCKKKLKKALKTTKPFRTLKGTAVDSANTGVTPVGVGTVEVNLVRKKGKKCEAFTGARFKKQKSCSKAQAIWFKVTTKVAADGSVTWSKKIKGLKPKWAYTARVRATDKNSNLQKSGYGKLSFKPKKK